MRMLCFLSGNDDTLYVQQLIKQLSLHAVHVDTTSNALLINEDSLSLYPAIVLLGGDVANWGQRQKNAFERFIQAGGGCMLKYNADTVVNWPWFNGLLKSIAAVENNRQATTAYDGGRISFFNAASEQSLFSNEHALQQAVQFACGSFLLPDYSNAITIKMPDERRFSKRQLAADLNRPVQMTILPSGDILIAEHEGDILYVNPKDNTVSKAMHLEVYHIYSDKDRSGDTEMGLLGLHHDPDFEKNHWIYVYYSAPDKSVDRLSRFTLEDKKLLPASERIILEVPTERYYPMAHTGGGMAFDAAKNLYLSTGDNTNPFFLWDTITGRDHPYNVNGFAPIDDRPLYKHSDDRRAAGNSNDLRGKILRIRINEDGSYSVPDGNLFPKNDPKAKPEIYTMGNRNPYRISVDQHTGFLYWGEVGPDAYRDSLETRGPKGYDEINQAKRAGNFGYPYFVGNNYPYRAYDYATGISGPPFDPHRVINDSRNNTGLGELPDAQPAMIWYPYDKSPYFPILGEGGRSAMAGPVYYTSDYPAKERLPDYYNGKLFIYDWARSWIMAVTMKKDGMLQYIEPFLPSLKFNSPVDMKADADGRLYVLEYGSGWGVNPDADLFVIDYRAGNMLPVAGLTVSNRSGALPLKQKFSAHASYDPDGKITLYKWHTGNDKTITSHHPELEYSFESPGIYPVRLTVFDDKGDSAQSALQHIIAGNSAPEVKINVEGDPTYYFPGSNIAYHIDVGDKEDGNVSNGGIDTKNMRVNISYQEGGDRIMMDSPGVDNGEVLMLSLDCKSCHKKQDSSQGPSFSRVAERYASTKDAAAYITKKIIQGSSGVWGSSFSMPAHPSMSVPVADKLANWILSLKPVEKGKSPRMSGMINPNAFTLTDKGIIRIEVSYNDKGFNGLPSLSARAEKVLLNPLITISSVKQRYGIARSDEDGYYLLAKDSVVLTYDHLPLNGVRSMKVLLKNDGMGAGNDHWELSIHLESPSGKRIAHKQINSAEAAAIELTGDAYGTNENNAVCFVWKKVSGGKNKLLLKGFLLRNR